MDKTDIIDVHVHCNNPGLVREAMDLLSANGVERAAMINPGFMGRKGKSGNANPALMAAKKQFPGRIYTFGGINHVPGLKLNEEEFSKDLAEQAKRLKGMGMDGVKLIEHKPSCYANYPYPLAHKVFEPFFSELEELGLPLVWHVADPEIFWDTDDAPEWVKKSDWYYGDGDFPSKEDLHTESMGIVSSHPKLKVIFAHFYFLSADLDRLGKLFDEHPNMNVDLAPGTEMFYNFTADIDKARDFFIKYRQRIFYGTDIALWGEKLDKEQSIKLTTFVGDYLETGKQLTSPWPNAEEGVGDLSITGLKLEPDVRDDICRKNFERLTSSSPALLNEEKALEECQRLDAQSTDQGGEPDPVIKESMEIIRGD